MGTFTGRQSSGKLGRFGKALLDGLDAVATASHDAPMRRRIEEIDALIPELRQERDHLIHGLYEPGDLEVSSDYNPNWVKPAVLGDPIKSDWDRKAQIENGRLTKCSGDWCDNDAHSRAHPGCPYRLKQHVAHEFTLRD